MMAGAMTCTDVRSGGHQIRQKLKIKQKEARCTNWTAQMQDCTYQVAAHGQKIERRYGSHESFEPSVLKPIPHAGTMVRGLLGMHCRRIFGTESQKIWHFRAYVNFSLPHVLAGAEHCCGAQLRAAVATHNIGCFQGDCTSITQGHSLPMAASLQSSTNSILILQKTMNVNGMQQYSKHEL
jgi:hypothetical protein